MAKLLFTLSILFYTTNLVFGTDYHSRQTGNWANKTTWSLSPPPSAQPVISPATPTPTHNSPFGDRYYIYSGHTVTLTAGFQMHGELTIYANGILNGGNEDFIIGTKTAVTGQGYGDIQFGTTPKTPGVFGQNTSGSNTFGIIFNYGTITNVDKLDIDGYLYNNESGVINLKELHSDWYTCNSGIITASGKVTMHGGMTDCCGDIFTNTLEWKNQDNNKAYSYFTETEDQAYHYEGDYAPLSGVGFAENIAGQPSGLWTSHGALGNSIVSCQNYCGLDGISYPTTSTDPGGAVTNLGDLFDPTYQPSSLYLDTTANADDVTFCGFGVLPIELIEFNVALNSNYNVDVSWNTSSEINNDYFTVLRSFDGENWEEIRNVEGAGNSTSISNYSIEDSPRNVGIIYYRLKQTDFNGLARVYYIRHVYLSNLGYDLLLFPNPADNYIDLVLNEKIIGEIQVYNMLGESVTDDIQIINKSSHQAQLNIDNLNSGLYIIKANNQTGKFVKK